MGFEWVFLNFLNLNIDSTLVSVVFEFFSVVLDLLTVNLDLTSWRILIDVSSAPVVDVTSIPLAGVANQPGGPQQPDPFMPFIMMGGIILIMYFMMIRPQSKRAKEHKALIGALKKGDEIILTGGILGKIVNVDEQYVVIQIADKVDIKVQKASVSSVLPKGTLKAIQAS